MKNLKKMFTNFTVCDIINIVSEKQKKKVFQNQLLERGNYNDSKSTAEQHHPYEGQ